jgi:hypothetical protein
MVAIEEFAVKCIPDDSIMVRPLSEKDLLLKKGCELRHMLSTRGISCGAKASYSELKRLLLNSKVDKSLARTKEMNRASWELLKATAPVDVQNCLGNIQLSHYAGRSAGHQVCEISIFIIRSA